MWKIVQELLVVAVGLIVLTQIIIPSLFSSFKFFWIFKRNWLHEKLSDEDIKNLSEDVYAKYNQVKPEVDKTKEKVKDLQDEVNDEWKAVRDLKKKTDHL